MPGQQDTVHSYRPTLPITYQYHLKPGESFYKDRNGKVTIVRSRNEQVSKDTRNNWQKKQDSRNAPSIRKQKQITQAEHKTAQVASNILDRVRPSKLVTAVVRGQKPMDYIDNGNEGTGNEIVNTGFDILSTFGTNALFNMTKFPKLNQINLGTTLSENSNNLELFNQGRLALMRRYRQSPIWENNAKAAGLTDQEVETFRNYANGLLSTKQSPESNLLPLKVQFNTKDINSNSEFLKNMDGTVTRNLNLGQNQSHAKYTGVHESGHMSTMNYDPSTEYKAYGVLFTNNEAKQATEKIMKNAENLANQLQVDPQKIIKLRRALIAKGQTPEEVDKLLTQHIKYLKRPQETRARALAAQEWMQDNHSVDVKPTIDNGVNFFTDESLRNVWRNMAVTVPGIWGYSQTMQNNTQEKQTK